MRIWYRKSQKQHFQEKGYVPVGIYPTEKQRLINLCWAALPCPHISWIDNNNIQKTFSPGWRTVFCANKTILDFFVWEKLEKETSYLFRDNLFIVTLFENWSYPDAEKYNLSPRNFETINPTFLVKKIENKEKKISPITFWDGGRTLQNMTS